MLMPDKTREILIGILLLILVCVLLDIGFTAWDYKNTATKADIQAAIKELDDNQINRTKELENTLISQLGISSDMVLDRLENHSASLDANISKLQKAMTAAKAARIAKQKPVVLHPKLKMISKPVKFNHVLKLESPTKEHKQPVVLEELARPSGIVVGKDKLTGEPLYLDPTL